MSKATPYEVWMGFKNYRGEINDISVVAAFCSKQRAFGYIDTVLPFEDGAESMAYGMYVGNKMYHITPYEFGGTEEEREDIK